MLLSVDERDRRWGLAQTLMEERGLDAVIAAGVPGDGPAHARYFTLFAHPLHTTAVALFRDGDVEFIAPSAILAAFAAKLSWLPDPVVASGSLGRTIAERLALHGAQRIGFAGLDTMRCGWRDAILEQLPGATFADVAAQVLAMRAIKSEEELTLIRESGQIADLAWEAMPEIVKAGRREYEVLADIRHILDSRGCDGSFDLVWSLPLFDAPFDRSPSDRMIEHGDVLLVEVSPRVGGYYSQLTSVVTTGGGSSWIHDAFEAAVTAREQVLPMLRAGSDVTDISRAIDAELRRGGHFRAGRAHIGHLCGLELVEPDVGGQPLMLEQGMVVIVHPFVSSDDGLDKGLGLPLRGDTYVITADGAERLQTYPMEVLDVGERASGTASIDRA